MAADGVRHLKKSETFSTDDFGFKDILAKFVIVNKHSNYSANRMNEIMEK